MPPSQPPAYLTGGEVNGLVIHLSPWLSLAAGVLILVVPRTLNYTVAAWLIVTGLLGLGAIH